MKTGLVYDLDAATYHAAPGELSVSGAKTIIKKTPLHYKWEREHPVYKDTFDFGSAAHALALEGDATAYVEIPADVLGANGALSTKAAKEFIAGARAQGKIPLKSADITRIEEMAEALRKHEAAAYLLSAGTPEVSAYRQHETGVTLRARFDWLPDDRTIIPDYKTAESASTSDFQRAAATYGYHMQAAWYTDMLRHLEGVDPKFVFIVQEKTAPYAVNIVELDSTAIGFGRQLNEKAIRIFAECQRTNHWPGYPLGEPIPLPRYAEYEAEKVLTDE